MIEMQGHQSDLDSFIDHDLRFIRNLVICAVLYSFRLQNALKRTLKIKYFNVPG